ncbi:hypothetical protein LCGC14_1036350 [marine sediment metagenome]|uniref:Uncharacterized protein n=1 Tax=marine sediment metagenome TaxID=412755 RepID=A0A0F9MXQ8_9ZZZZ
MLRLLFTLVLALPSVVASAVALSVARRTRAALEGRVADVFYQTTGVEQSRNYVPSWAKPEE